MTEEHDDARSAPRGTFAIAPRGAFSLEASIRFLEGFPPVTYEAPAARTLDFAFALEESWLTVGVSLEQMGAEQAGARRPGADVSGEVRGRVFAERALKRSELSAVRAQVERILSLDIDGTGFAGPGGVGDRDPVIGAAQRRHPGLRPVCFWSWYEAAAWAIISQRVRRTQAAVVKQRLADELGTPVLVNGVARQAFPAPAALARLEWMPGLTVAKVERLRALADAARRNDFDSASLRALPRDEALRSLETLAGVGPFSAELILLRGAGDPDWAPLNETHLRLAVADAYELDAPPSDEQLAEISAAWAPFRTWATLLLRTQHEDDLADSDAAR
ncbi:DNA-3-methyladenine glycosylase family protein [Herbiconiux daphne]|uniref:DNA-3-methyladenine glycosylase II n=1 Tax=Herbiconiux daphne TaxID=2970914 RepID=A0ABT2H433_9MICO|nr:hypothetical protein [Herbiconiux daphne]MCS5734688.1 hypothetical protein [Herbiconiux daphne]